MNENGEDVFDKRLLSMVPGAVKFIVADVALQWVALACNIALFVVIGHNWPVFYHFQGGKGVACSTAVVLLIHFWCGLPSILLCVLVIAVTKYISLGSMTMLLTYMVLIWIVCFGQWALCIFATLLFIMCVYRHRANIQRLLNGTENKIGSTPPRPAPKP